MIKAGQRKSCFKPLKTTHQRYADVFARLNLPIDISHVSCLNKEQLSDTTLELVAADTKKWIGIAPFAAFEGKRYSLELMERVLKQLNDEGKYKMLLFGGGKEEVRQLAVWESKFLNCVNIAGKLSFNEELSLISNLDLMLSMDSGNAHLAAMYGIPTVTLWGVTHPYAGFYPYGQDSDNALLADRNQFPLIPTSVYGNKFPKGYEKAIATISPDQVIRKIKQVLEK